MPSSPNRPLILVGALCSGCGACAEVRPELFGYDEDGQKAVPRVMEAPEEDIREAQSWCPCDCIEIGDGPVEEPGE